MLSLILKSSPSSDSEVVIRRFQGEGVEFFFKSDLTDHPSSDF